MLTTVIGVAAAALTTVSYIPQLVKCWRTGRADDLSLGMFSVLAGGIALWIVYGLLRQDAVIAIANSISLACLFGILSFKLRSIGRVMRKMKRAFG